MYDVASRRNARWSELGELLRRSGFTADSAVASVGAADVVDLLVNAARHSLFAEFFDAADFTDQPEVLTQLFVCNGTVPPSAYTGLVDPALRSALDDLALVGARDGGIGARVSISPYRSLYLLSDQLFTRAADHTLAPARGADRVMPPHASSFSLLRAVPPGTSGGVLMDVGCGCGVLGLSLSGSHTSVTGFDANPRAVAFSTVNAALNGIAAAFRHADVRALPPLRPAETLVFNSPGAISYKDGAGEFGGDPTADAYRRVMENLPRLVAGGGAAYIHRVAAVPDRYESATRFIDAELAALSIADFTLHFPVPSRFAVSEADLAAGEVPGECLLLWEPGDGNALVDHCRRHGIREISEFVVSVRSRCRSKTRPRP